MLKYLLACTVVEADFQEKYAKERKRKTDRKKDRKNKEMKHVQIERKR